MLHFDVSAKHCIRDFINKDTEITEKVLKFCFKRCAIAIMYSIMHVGSQPVMSISTWTTYLAVTSSA